MGLARRIGRAACAALIGGVWGLGAPAFAQGSAGLGAAGLTAPGATGQTARDAAVGDMIPDARPRSSVDATADPAAIDPASPLAPSTSLTPEPRSLWVAGPARWDDHPSGARWSQSVMQALRGHGAPLLDVVPQDIDAWCPAFPQSDDLARASF